MDTNNTKNFLALLAASQLPPEQRQEFILKHTGLVLPALPKLANIPALLQPPPTLKALNNNLAASNIPALLQPPPTLKALNNNLAASNIPALLQPPAPLALPVPPKPDQPNKPNKPDQERPRKAEKPTKPSKTDKDLLKELKAQTKQNAKLFAFLRSATGASLFKGALFDRNSLRSLGGASNVLFAGVAGSLAVAKTLNTQATNAYRYNANNFNTTAIDNNYRAIAQYRGDREQVAQMFERLREITTQIETGDASTIVAASKASNVDISKIASYKTDQTKLEYILKTADTITDVEKKQRFYNTIGLSEPFRNLANAGYQQYQKSIANNDHFNPYNKTASTIALDQSITEIKANFSDIWNTGISAITPALAEGAAVLASFSKSVRDAALDIEALGDYYQEQKQAIINTYHNTQEKITQTKNEAKNTVINHLNQIKTNAINNSNIYNPAAELVALKRLNANHSAGVGSIQETANQGNFLITKNNDLPKPQPLPQPPAQAPRNNRNSINAPINNHITINATGGDPQAIADAVSKASADLLKQIQETINNNFKGVNAHVGNFEKF